jgi:ATP-dependent Clp protease ATP-binding subunit ClpA
MTSNLGAAEMGSSRSAGPNCKQFSRSNSVSVCLLGDRYLLREGTDMKYGARHLKRTIDRALVHPMSI